MTTGGFVLAIWPDRRSKTPKALTQLIATEDKEVYDLGAFSKVSIAAQGFHALEFLLYDADFAASDKLDYQCALIRAITSGISDNAAAISQDWQNSCAATLLIPSAGCPYRNEKEAVQALFKSLATGLQFTSDTRLSRPLGAIDKPRPKRTEAHRSGRSMRHVELSIEAASDLAAILSQGTSVSGEFEVGFARALQQIAKTDDPNFTKIASPSGRFQIEIIRLELENLRDEPMQILATELGVTSGFNALDGD